jgi:hypothetical protein
LSITVHHPGSGGKARNRADWPIRQRFQLNRPVPDSPAPTSYRLAPALGARLVGRSLITLAALVLLATSVGLLVGAGWVPAGVVTLVGLLLAAGWAWWLLRVAWALRLTVEGYAVRLLGGVGATTAPWTDVVEAVATSPGGERCLVLRLVDGRATRLPMAALAADPEAVAVDVRRRLRDAHSTGVDGVDLDADPDPAPGASSDDIDRT